MGLDTQHYTPQLTNRALYRNQQARHDLQRDIQTKWYYKKVSSIHNGALVRQEYRVTWLEPPIPIGANFDPQDLLSQLDRADGSADNRLSMPPLPPMGLPPLPFPTSDPSSGVGFPPPSSFLLPMAQEPPPPYTPPQSTMSSFNQPNQFNFLNGFPTATVNRVPFQAQPSAGDATWSDNRMLTNGYNGGPAIPCNCSQCHQAGQ